MKGKLSKQKRREVITWYLTGRSQAEIARMMRLAQSTISQVITDAMKSGDIYADSKIYAPAEGIKEHDYTGASEYTLHFKGAEFEDTRFKELRELGAKHPLRYSN
jgi:IS30 family transposase